MRAAFAAVSRIAALAACLTAAFAAASRIAALTAACSVVWTMMRRWCLIQRRGRVSQGRTGRKNQGKPHQGGQCPVNQGILNFHVCVPFRETLKSKLWQKPTELVGWLKKNLSQNNLIISPHPRQRFSLPQHSPQLQEAPVPAA